MANLLDLSGKVILVTGASSGLGRHFAIALAGAGATVIAAARRGEELEKLVAEIGGHGGQGGRAHVVVMDVTDLASVQAGVAEAARLAGSLDGLVNNSGVTETVALLDQTEAGWDRVLDTNLKGAWAVATETARHWVAAGKGGAIVNIASIIALRQGGQLSAYATSKAALVQLTKQMALEWARHGIRVNALAPGYIETDFNRDFFASEAGQAMVKRIPQRRLGQPGDLDGALKLLLSDAASYITGAVLAVDGGHLVSSL
jgi:NAD(P)-dependent dehydrogenase (short-subunit alcohol dehydrogenase family)